jgi:kynurenine formamidase
MCCPAVVQQSSPALDRRSLLRAGGAALAGVAFGVSGANGQPAPQPLHFAHLADLTHPLTGDFPLYPAPANTPFRKAPIAGYQKDGYFANRWELVEHTGTHMDAPCHFAEGQSDLGTLPARQLVAPFAVLDLRDRAARDPATAVTVDDVLAWEKRHGRLPANAAVFLNSGWDAKAKDAKAFLGRDRSGVLHFPGFAAAAVEFLVRERSIIGIGVDTLSLDIGPSADFAAHKALLRADKWGLECIANLSQVPPAGATVLVGALRVPGASGGPCRVLAVW